MVHRASWSERMRHCCPFVFWLLHLLAVRNAPCLDSITHRSCWSNFPFFFSLSPAFGAWESYGWQEKILYTFRYIYRKLEKNMPLERMANLLNRARNHNCSHRSNNNNRKRSMHKFRRNIYTYANTLASTTAPSVYPNSTCSPPRFHWPIYGYLFHWLLLPRLMYSESGLDSWGNSKFRLRLTPNTAKRRFRHWRMWNLYTFYIL